MTARKSRIDLARHLEQLLSERHSCRAFRPDEIAEETIDRVLELAQQTATWCNSQPWQVVLVSGQLLERLRRELPREAVANTAKPDFSWPREYRGRYLDRRRQCGFALYEAVGIARDDKAARREQALQNFRFFDAPHVAFVTTPEELGVYGAVDCGAYIANFCLAAHALGLGSVAQAALGSHPQFLRNFLGIPDDRLILAGISFGIEDTDHPANRFRTPRASVATAVERRS